MSAGREDEKCTSERNTGLLRREQGDPLAAGYWGVEPTALIWDYRWDQTRPGKWTVRRDEGWEENAGTHSHTAGEVGGHWEGRG